VPALLRIRGVTIAAVADPDEAFRNRVARAAGTVAFKSAEFLLANSDVDAVIIATPPETHASIATMAARAGKAIYLEKPMATTVGDAVSLSKEAREARIRAVVGFNRRSHPLFCRGRSAIARGVIGQLRAIQTTFCEPVPVDGMPKWKQRRSTGGGVLLDLASHHIDAVRWLTGAEISYVLAQVQSSQSEQDSASLEMRLDNGVMAQGFFSFRSGCAETITLIGEDGSLELDRHAGSLSLKKRRRFGYGASRRFSMPSISDVTWKARRMVRPSHDPSYRSALTGFVNDSSGLPDLIDGEMAVRVVIAAEESAIDGRFVSVMR
jgi:predicted dehydrogenase